MRHQKDMVEEIKKRKSSVPQVFFSFFLASLADHGILRQGLVDVTVIDAAKKCYNVLTKMGFIQEKYENSFEGLENMIKDVLKALNVSDNFKITGDGKNYLELHIVLDSCKYCPKGIGGAQIPGTICPFYRLLEAMAKAAGIKCECTQDAVKKVETTEGKYGKMGYRLL